MLIPAAATASASPPRKKPFYTGLSFQVLLGVAMAILLGYISPAKAVAMKPLGDAFIRLITMIITLVIFCTLVTGIAGMEDMKTVGRVGGKALLYFQLVSTLRVCVFSGRLARQATCRPLGQFDSSRFWSRGHPHAFCPHWSLRRYGLHCRQIRFGVARPSRETTGYALHYVHPVRGGLARGHCACGRLRNFPVPLVPP